MWVVNKFHLSPVIGEARHVSCLTMFSMPETYLVSHDLSPKSQMRICPCCAVADGGGFKHLCPIQNPLYEEDKEEGISKLEMVMGLSNFHFNTIFNCLSDSLSDLYQPGLFSYQVTEMSMAWT